MSKTNLIEQSPAVVQAIHDVFHQSEPCHCTGPGKLSEDEVLEALVRLRHVAMPDVPQQDLLPLKAMGRSETVMFGMSYHFEQAGVKSLTQLEAWTFADLLRISNIGQVKAAKIEAVMAKYGLKLKDGDPARYQHFLEDEPTTERPVIDLPPDQLREHCASELLAAGEQLVQHGASVMRSSLRATKRVKVGAALKISLKAGIASHRALQGIAQLLHDLEQREATVRRLAKPSPRVPAEARQQGNVVVGAFVPPDHSPAAPSNGQAI